MSEVRYFSKGDSYYRLKHDGGVPFLEMLDAATGFFVEIKNADAAEFELQATELEFDNFVQYVEAIREPLFDGDNSAIGVIHTLTAGLRRQAEEEGKEINSYCQHLIKLERIRSFTLFENLTATKEAADLMRKDLKKRSEE